MQIQVLDGGRPPQMPKDKDVGYDCFARIGVVIPPGTARKVPLGFIVKPADGCFIDVRERSGLALECVELGGGTGDPGYRGELSAIVRNFTQANMVVEAGDKVCQIAQIPFVVTPIELVDSLDETERGDNGFGSSGRK